MKTSISTAAVIEREGRVLVAKRLPGGSCGGKWEFPGGKVEEGETPQEGLRRELLEEFETESRVGTQLGQSEFRNKGVSYRLMIYSVEIDSDNLRLNEHSELRWLPLKELAGLDLAESDRGILHLLLARGT